MNSGSGGASLKIFQDTAMDIYRSFAPVIRRCTAWKYGTSAERMASLQQGDNLKWQQDMFLRLMNMIGLHNEGLIEEEDVARFRQKILDRIVVCFDGGEGPGVTRDKLLFVQELLYARCISEEEYHSVKKPLLYRLADQGAEIDARDIVLSSSGRNAEPPTAPPRDISEACSKSEAISVHKTKSPVKHFMEAAVSRLKTKGKAVRLILPKDCPARDPPSAVPLAAELESSDQCGSPLFHSPASSVESSSKRPIHHPLRSKVMRPVDIGDSKVLSPKVNPDTVKIKKKLHSKGASTDFFIDKVLGQKIKQQLERFRSDMRRTSSNQILTDDQIDAISTRLPADKAELMRFFPKSWCDRYGDIVLDVVQQEFKNHVKEMEASRRSARRENDENNRNAQNTDPVSAAASGFPSNISPLKPSTTRCLAAAADENRQNATVRTPKKVTSFQASAEYEKELDGKLCAEIQKLPLGRSRPLRY